MDRAGSLGRLRRHREALRRCGREARVRLGHCPNPADISPASTYSATPKGTFIMGLEFAGVIEEVGHRRNNAASRRPAARR
jgi:NADPH:quinone reductase-like Zn-dependent oxidoreductase